MPVETLVDPRLEAGQHDGAHKVGLVPGVLLGRKGSAQGHAGGTAGGRDMPVLVLLRILVQLQIGPVPQFLLGQHRKLVQILCTGVILRRGAGGLEPFPIEGNAVGDLHQLPHLPILHRLDLGRVGGDFPI